MMAKSSAQPGRRRIIASLSAAVVLHASAAAANELDELILASTQGDMLSVQRILKLSPGMARSAEPVHRVTALHNAAGNGSTAIVTALLNAGADVDALDFNGATPLIHAVAATKAGAAQLLLTRGAQNSINHRPARAPTALVLAVQSRQRDLVQMLLVAGADPQLADAFGTTPLQAAIWLDDAALREQIEAADRGRKAGER